MPNINILNGSGEAVTYSNVDEVALPTSEGGEARFVSDHLIHDQVQADWNQADATQADHIKNKPFGPIPAFLEEGEVPFAQMENFYRYGSSSTVLLELGEQYRVIWDGTEYLCTAMDVSRINSAFSGAVFLGNPTAVWGAGMGTDTGEPFVILCNKNTWEVEIETYSAEASHRVGVYPVEEIKKLDERYLPFTSADVAAMLASAGVISPVADENNRMLADSEQNYYIW